MKELDIEKKQLKEHKFPIESFIGGWYCDKKICDNIINYFNINNHLHKKGESAYVLNNGNVEKIVNKDVKESIDLVINSARFDIPFFEYRKHLSRCLQLYIEKYNFVNEYPFFNVNEDYNIQKYPINGGFKKWHFENASADYYNRLLVFMTYLNDVEDGGTEFLYQKIASPAKKGLTLIWPANWTHTHRGIISSTNEKIIITGWFSLDNLKLKYDR